LIRISWLSGAIAVACAVSVGLVASGPVAAARPAQPAGVTVDGAVASPATYSLSALAALPQSTFTAPAGRGSRPGVDQGVSLESLVELAVPQLPAAKNALLRVVITVTGEHGTQRTLALGELDPNFGNHPAYLALQEGGVALAEPELVVPGDANGIRGVPDVSEISVAVESPGVTAPPAVGDLTIEDGGRTVVLALAQLAALPAQTLTVSFAGPGGLQTHTETGPTLDAVLRAAHIQPDLNTWVAGVGSDDYVATVTPAEAWVGGRPLLISLAEDGQSFVSQAEGPRLVTDGDVKGGRYDSGMEDLVVGDTQLPDRP
jgi:hypothetical protein